MEVHPAANSLPMMNDEELQGLGDDIRDNGLREAIKIVVVQDKELLLDGRNRLKACEAAGVEPRFESVNGDDPLATVTSANVKRRKMLTMGQRAIAAAESWPLVGGAPKRGSHKQDGGNHRLTFNQMARQWEVSETASGGGRPTVSRAQTVGGGRGPLTMRRWLGSAGPASWPCGRSPPAGDRSAGS